MNRFVSVIVGVILLLIPGVLKSIGPQKPNVLWIIAEDMCPDLGCYGNEHVKTPYLDRFASEGALFTNCFTTGAVCSASRSAMITGMYQTAIGAQNHRTSEEYKPDLPQGVKLIPEYFREAGYFTVLCSSGDKKKSKTIPGPWGSGKTDFNFKMHEKSVFDGYDWSQRLPGQPFFGYLTLLATHRGSWWDDMPNVTSPDSLMIPPQYPDNVVSRQDFADFYDAVSGMDKNFGQIIQRLKEEGLYENTIIVFMADHGQPMPRGKQFCYDEGTHVPLLIHAPGYLEAGSKSDALISAIDIPVTLMEMCRIETPSNVHGISFLSESRDYVISARDRCDETVMRIRSVRDSRYRYVRNYDDTTPYTAPNRYKDTRYPIMRELRDLYSAGSLNGSQAFFFKDPRPREELYDCWVDPHNVSNVAENPDFSQILTLMRCRLDEWLKTYPDSGEQKEDQKVLDLILLQRQQEYGY